MAFRDELGAAQARADALERRVAELETENRGLREGPDSESEEPPPAAPIRRTALLLGLAILLIAGAIAGVFAQTGDMVTAAIIGALAVAIVVQLAVVVAFLEVVPPGFALVLSGRQRVGPGGAMRGYRVVMSGRVMRIPIIETVDRLDMRPRSVDRELPVYLASKEQVTVRFASSIKLAAVEPRIDNAIERFLGRDPREFERVACEILEGHVRSCAALVEAAQLREDSAAFSHQVIREAEDDLARCGIELDTLTVELSG